MSDSSEENPKKIRAKVDSNLVENCIYKVDTQGLSLNVRVTKRINKKQHVKFKRNIRGITRARQVRTQFINELEILAQEILEGNLLWPKAVEKYFLQREAQVAAKTFIVQKSEVEAHTKSWGEKRLREFSRAFVEKELRLSLNNHEKSTVKSVLKHIRAVFEFYVGNGDAEYPLQHNPCKGIQPWGKKNTEGRQKRLPKMTSEEINRLLDYTEEHHPQFHAIIATGYFSGLRSGELFALQWQNIDPEFRELKVTHSYCFASKALKSPKNGDERVVPIGSELRTLLKKLKLNSKSEYVLPQMPMWRDGKISVLLNKIQVEELGIQKTSFHSLRASHITHLLMAGASLAKVMASSGHSMLSTTQRYLRDVEREKDFHEMMDLLNRKKPSKGEVVPFRKSKKG